MVYKNLHRNYRLLQRELKAVSLMGKLDREQTESYQRQGLTKVFTVLRGIGVVSVFHPGGSD